MAVQFTGGDPSNDRVLETFGDVFQQMVQGVVRMQEAMRQQFLDAQHQLEQKLDDMLRQRLQEIHNQHELRLQEALRGQEQKLQENFQQQLQAALFQQEERRLAALRVEEKAVIADPTPAFSGGYEGEEPRESLETRMQKLEASVDKALADVFPRVDAILAHLEKSPAPPQFPPTLNPPSSSPNAPELQPVSPKELEEAVKKGREDDVRRLLDAGADVNVRVNREWTLLMLAAKEAHPDVVSLLLERHADVHATTWDGRTALHYAAYNDPSGRCVSLLIAAGANVNSRRLFGATPLNDAVTARNETGVRALLEAGAIKTAGSKYSRSPLDYAKSRAIRRLFQL